MSAKTFALLLLLPLLMGCYKDDVQPELLNTNPFDADYQGEDLFVSESTFTETENIPGVGIVIRQVIAFRVRSELFLAPTSYSVQVHDLENGQTVVIDAVPPGSDTFKYYKQNLVAGQPVCLELRLSNNFSVARAERICVTL